MGKRIEFVVDSNNYCFVCLREVKTEAKEKGQTSLFSLEALSRYLKMDRRKVFNETAPIPPLLMEKVERATLKVKLCLECAPLNQKFSTLYNLLQSSDHHGHSKKINMSVTGSGYICILHERTKTAGETRLLKLAKPFKELKNGMEKLEIMKALREDFIKKCSQKLTPVLPQLQLKNLSLDEVAVEKRKLKARKIGSGRRKFSCTKIRPTLRQKGVPKEPKISYNSKTKTFSCKLCRKLFGAKEAFLIHYDAAHLKLRYRCNLCGMEFPYRRSCRRHHQVAHQGIAEQKPYYEYKCLDCGKKYRKFINLKRHWIELHLENGKPIVCLHCGKDFTSVDGLFKHVKGIYKQGRGLTCTLCTRSFLRKVSLATHKQRAVCGPDGKKREGPPRNRSKRPKAIKPPPVYGCHCPICGQGFIANCHLTVHIKTIHEQIRKYCCELCEKKFKRAAHLANHVKAVHLKLREFGCDQCGKRYGRKHHLTDHRWAVHSLA